MKPSFSVYCIQTLAALSITMAVPVHAGEYTSDISGPDVSLNTGSLVIPDMGNPGLETGGNLTISGGSVSTGNGEISIGGGSLILPGTGTGDITIGNTTIGKFNINGGNVLLPSKGSMSINTLTIEGGGSLTAGVDGSLDVDTMRILSGSAEFNGNLGGSNIHIKHLTIYNDSSLKCQGITMAQDAGSTLQLINATLSQMGYNVDVNAGNTFGAEGNSHLATNSLNMTQGSNLQLAVNSVNNMEGSAVLTTTGELSMGDVTLDLQGVEYLLEGRYKLLTRTEGTNLDTSNWTINGADAKQLSWENGTLYYTSGANYNRDAKTIDDLEEILGNLIIDGDEITLEGFVKAVEEALEGSTGHIVINRGGIHISGAGELDGHIIFNGNLKDIRKLFIEKDVTNITIDLVGGSENENNVDISDGKEVEVDSLSGKGGMKKTGKGKMVIHGNGHDVGGTLAIQEGQMILDAEPEAGEARNDDATQIRDLAVGNDEDKETELSVGKNARVEGETMSVDGSQAVVTNEGSMNFTDEVLVTKGHLDNNGSISKVTMNGGKISGSGSFAGLDMKGGKLVVGNSPGLQTYTKDAALTQGSVVFSVADTKTAATADTHGWNAAAYSTIDMGGNALTLGGDIRFVLEIGGDALLILTADEGATLTLNLNLIQNIADESLTLGDAEFAALLGNTTIIITEDADGLTDSTRAMAGKDITAMLSNASYAYSDNTLTFSGTLTYNSNLLIPEPATATLSLLALAALAARRRRQ